MTRTELIPCNRCQRHVRSNESDCPFCGAAQPTALASQRREIPRGTSRAAAFALRAALVTATVGVGAGAGCAASHDRDDEPDAAVDAGRASDAQLAAVDAAAPRDAQPPPDAQAVADASKVDAARDAAPDAARDASSEAGAQADARIDSGEEDAWVPIPLYGGVFPDPRTRARV